MADYYLFFPILLALAIGWWMGRRDWRKKQQERFRDRLKEEYFSGLNHLVDNQTDEAIESFIKALQYNTETVPIRLALGTLFRRRGEIQRAIQLHQEVLSHSSLTHQEYLQTQIALSQDYLAAGLLDRAEEILLDVVERKDSATLERALQLLIDLYQQEKEWQKALDVARMLPQQKGKLASQLAHFCCELAVLAMQQQDWKEARRLLSEASSYDMVCVRASLLWADVEMAEGRWKAAIKRLRRVPNQDPAFISEAVSRLADCYHRLNAQSDLRRELETTMQVAPSTTGMLLIADEIAQQQGDYPAGAYITDQLKRRPSVKGFNRLIDLHLKYASSGARESLNVLRGLTGQLEQSKPLYQCNYCGFSGKTLHWQCPSCKQWGQVKPIQGLEGE